MEVEEQTNQQHPCGVPNDMYRSPAFVGPTRQQTAQMAEGFGFHMSDEELAEYTELIGNCTPLYQRVDELSEPLLPVKYPRTPGYRPDTENNPYNAWYWCTDIRGADDGPLAGKTIGIKDNVPVAGVPMMNGSRLLEGYVPEFDATVVTRILDAGGRILGKTAVEDLCFDGYSFTNAKAPVLNPRDPNRSAGGSSSGSAALVAGGIVDMAIGGDQLGSIRGPSSLCGIVGLKPTFGLVPYTGASSILPSFDHLGPMARNVYDCALLLEVIAGRDGDLDPRQPVDLKVPNYTKMLKEDVTGLKIGVLQEGFDHATAEVAGTVREAVTKLKSLGAVVEDTSVPMHKDGETIARIMAVEGCYDTVITGNGVGTGWKGFYPTSLQKANARGRLTSPDDLPNSLKFMMLTAKHARNRYQGQYYSKAANMSRVLRQAYDKALETYDVLVMPTMIKTADKSLSVEDSKSKKVVLADSMYLPFNTGCFNLTGHPALSINAGFVEQGLPVGMMIVGKHFDEATVLRVAYAYEKLRDGN